VPVPRRSMDKKRPRLRGNAAAEIIAEKEKAMKAAMKKGKKAAAAPKAAPAKKAAMKKGKKAASAPEAVPTKRYVEELAKSLNDVRWYVEELAKHLTEVQIDVEEVKKLVENRVRFGRWCYVMTSDK